MSQANNRVKTRDKDGNATAWHARLQPVQFGKSRTKQSFKDSTDINKILRKAQKTGTISHLQKHGASYGDFTDIPDLLTAQSRLIRGREIFEELPSELRSEFDQDMGKFFAYVNDPANVNDLARLLPALAEPGRQFPNVNAVASSGQASVGGVSEPVASETVQPSEGVPEAPSSPEGGSQ